MNKKQKISLSIGIIILVITLTAIIAIRDINETVVAYESDLELFDSNRADDTLIWCIFAMVLLRTPLLISDICIIKNIYVFLKGKYSKHIKVLFWGSTLLSLQVIIMPFQLELISNDTNLNNNILLYLWPISIVALILGFIRVRNKKHSTPPTQ